MVGEFCEIEAPAPTCKSSYVQSRLINSYVIDVHADHDTLSNMNVTQTSLARSTADCSDAGQTKRSTATSLRLTEQVKRHVNSGVFSPGDRYLSIRELARRFRVSPVTMQRSVRDLVSEGVLYVRGNAGTFVGATAREAPAALQFVRVIAPDLPSQRERLFRQGLAEGLLSSMPGVSMQMHFLPPADPLGFLNALYKDEATELKVIGALLLRVPRVVREFFDRRRFPAVVLGHVEDHINLPSIDRDQRAIGERLIEFLSSKGHQRMGLLMMDAWNPGDNHLLHGIQQAMSAASLPGAALTIQSMADDPAMIHALVTRIASLSDRPTALICRTDTIAIESIAALEQLGLRVPRDMAVVSIGNDNPALQQARPSITAMTNNHEVCGRLAGELLMSMYRGQESVNRRIVSPAELIEREST
ncbi:MAG: substrate-binding domain-containing protein [Pirellulales bacterium]